jgi:hypothetical protein
MLDYGQHVGQVLFIRTARILREPLRRQSLAREALHHHAIHLHLRLDEKMRHRRQRGDAVTERNSCAHGQYAEVDTEHAQARG